jgi:malonate-semialdehyde dehydrogenase (acetylating)/methylmalonate-semialdehyde dehydrogenase
MVNRGLLDGVFNVVQGGKMAVDGLLNISNATAVSFVGSAPIARCIYETGARNRKRTGWCSGHGVRLP